MRIEQLEYFQAVAKSRSMNLASEALYLTPQALSMAIKALEKELNVTLLHRNYNGITLTEEGEYISQLTDEILERVEKLRVFQDSPAADQAPLSGNIQFYVTPIAANIFIAPTIHPFLKAHPQVSVRLHEVILSEFLEQLPELHFDAAIIHVPLDRLSLLPQNYLAEFSFETIYSSKLAIICNKSHPLADKRTISWKMAREYPLLAVNERNLEDFALSELVEKYGEPQNLTLLSNFNLCLDGLFGNPQAIAISLANSQQFIDHPKRQELRSISLRENIPMAVLIIQRRGESIPEAAQVYLDGLRDFIQKRHKS